MISYISTFYENHDNHDIYVLSNFCILLHKCPFKICYFCVGALFSRWQFFFLKLKIKFERQILLALKGFKDLVF
jgi:hypothetical protein